MVSLSDLTRFTRDFLAFWRTVGSADLGFWHRDSARLAMLTFVALTGVALVARTVIRQRRSDARVALPALLTSLGSERFAFSRHTPLVLFLLSVPFLILALADPYSSLVKQTVSFPGRRISLMVDASSSMSVPFAAATLKTESTFRTTVAAAERFIRLRAQGKYRDLIALIEFGTRAYVITPFTSDYDNILLSASLIGDPTEFAKFPDKSTFIGLAIEESVELFRAFNFLEASGNLMVIFSDGEDERVSQDGRLVSEIVEDAVKAKIPIYMIRTNDGKALGDIIPDRMWKEAVEHTGGKFYAAANEATILQAIKEIDQVSEGTIELQQFAAQRPQFAPFALVAVVLLSVASMLTLAIPWFRRFP